VIRLLLAMLSARRGAALTVFALAAVASAAAAAGPLYRAAADSAAATAQISVADPGERSIRQTNVVHREQPTANVKGALAPELPYRPGFDTVYGLQVQGTVQAAGRPKGVLAGLAYRYGMCRHLVALTGRCVSGANEVMVSTRTATELGLAVGDPVSFSSLTPEVPAIPLTVVGTYQPSDGREPYWAGRLFGTEAKPTEGDEVLFVTRETVSTPPFTDTVVAVDLIASRAAFDDPAALLATLQDAQTQASLNQYTVVSEVEDLLDRIAADRNALADGVQLAALPLVLLCWFVLHLAVANSAFRRRAEFGLAGLRGVPRFTRWWLSTAEVAVPLLLGGGIGYLGGYLAGAALADRVLPGSPPVRMDVDSAWYALVAVGGALAVGLFAQWRATAAPVATLLRRVPVRHPARRIGAAEVVAVALAVVAGYQIRASGDPGGLAMLAPMFIALAVGLVAARMVGLVADRAGRRALRRGALGRALACLYLARQPGQARLLGVLVMLFAVLGFAVTAVDVGAAARTARVRAEMGAPRVLAVKSVSNRQLLSAVRAADPDGRYAMAVARMAGSGLRLLAVDPERLARVAIWDAGYGPAAARVAQSLQPQQPMQVRITGGEIEVRATVRVAPEKARLVARVVPPEGPAIAVDLGLLRPGTTVYRGAAAECATGGCRLLGLEPSTRPALGYAFDVTFHQLRQYGPEQVVIDSAGFADVGRWVTGGRNEVQATTAPAVDGIRVSYSGRFELGALLRPVGTPAQLPVAATAAVPATIPGGSLPIPVTRVATLHLVPGLGAAGGLINLEYAELATLEPGTALDPQVWLTADAPPQLTDRLREAGLVILADRTTKSEATQLGQRGPALALRFYLLVALAAVALGVGGVAVVAAADRWGQTGQLRALRAQGLSPAVPWKVGFGGYAALAGAALVLGTLAAALAWSLARTVIPFFADDNGSPYLPVMPRPLVASAALAGATLVLVGAGAVAAAALRRAVEAPSASSGKVHVSGSLPPASSGKMRRS
jgi:putative ABC transport system permease protein